MKFVDSVEIAVIGGNGGDGCIHWKREKYLPSGGPDGGNGGNGGAVIFKVDPSLNTLSHLSSRRIQKAEDGFSGSGEKTIGKKVEGIYFCHFLLELRFILVKN